MGTYRNFEKCSMFHKVRLENSRKTCKLLLLAMMQLKFTTLKLRKLVPSLVVVQKLI